MTAQHHAAVEILGTREERRARGSVRSRPRAHVWRPGDVCVLGGGRRDDVDLTDLRIAEAVGPNLQVRVPGALVDSTAVVEARHASYVRPGRVCQHVDRLRREAADLEVALVSGFSLHGGG